MPSIAVSGDCATTTVLALAAGWPTRGVNTSESALGDQVERNDRATPSDRDLILVEVDPRGGSLSAWLDTPSTPSLSTVVTALHQMGGSHTDDSSRRQALWSGVEPLIQRSSAGPRFIPAPIRSREAHTAVREASQRLLPLLAGIGDTTALLDTGMLDLTHLTNTFRFVDTIVVCHRQESASARAAAVRLERLAEQVETLTTAGHRVVIAIIGDQPFSAEEVASFVAAGIEHHTLPVDQLAAAVLAGRHGVSERRLARLPLMRAASALAQDLSRRLEAPNTAVVSEQQSSTRAPDRVLR